MSQVRLPLTALLARIITTSPSSTSPPTRGPPEHLAGWTPEEVQRATDAPLVIPDDLAELSF